MPAPHIKTLAHARSYIAALADSARTSSGSLAYERVLLELDAVFGHDGPAIEAISDDEDVHQQASDALGDLLPFEKDPLRIEILLAQLTSARETDLTACTDPTPAGFGPNSPTY